MSDHPHGHAHPHSTSSDAAPEASAIRDGPLERGAGAGQTLLLDTWSGIAGDMTIAALLDLGVPLSVVEGAVDALGLPGVRLEVRRVHAGAISALKVDVRFDPTGEERTHAAIDELLAAAPLEPPVAELARRIFQRLAEAEARVHAVPVAEVHFHEVGAVDAIVDVVGAAAGFAYLGAEVVATPLPLGRGMVTCRHGVIPLPAPATVECLRGAPTYDAGIDAELVTPTGAAIVTTVARRFVRWPSFIPSRIGWGAGERLLPDRPNALRMVLGRASTEGDAPAAATHFILEATVDDLTGELAAHTLRVLLAAGACDVWAIPVTMKKGRPGLILGALARCAEADALARVMLRESTTIGVRRVPVTRVERSRRTVEVSTRFGRIPVKISEGPFGSAQLKPEFDACVLAAEVADVPVREVIAEALLAARGAGAG